jgi:regulator of sigma E protease
MLITILATAFVLGVLIIVHELGHFAMAKLVDIEVPRFSIGLGPKMVGFHWGETEYVISWLPLGGYVKMAGTEEMDELEGGSTPRGEATSGASRVPGPRDFDGKPVGVRALVISAGVVMNAILAIVIYAGSALVWGIAKVPDAIIQHVDAAHLPPGAEALASLPAGTRVLAVNGHEISDWDDFITRLAAASGSAELRLAHEPPVSIRLSDDQDQRAALLDALQPEFRIDPVVGALIQGRPAERAGIEPGDRIISVAGRAISTWQELVTVVQSHAGQKIPIVVQRDDRTIRMEVTPEARPPADDSTAKPVGQIGVAPMLPIRHPGAAGAVAYGAHQTWYWASFTAEFVGQLVTGRASPRDLGGPILIGKLSGEMARRGAHALLGFMAFLSIQLAIFNLLPIPVLDGGHMLFLGIEAARGRALTLEQRIRLSQLGLVVLVAFFVWVMANDLLRLVGI